MTEEVAVKANANDVFERHLTTRYLSTVRQLAIMEQAHADLDRENKVLRAQVEALQIQVAELTPKPDPEDVPEDTPSPFGKIVDAASAATNVSDAFTGSAQRRLEPAERANGKVTPNAR